MPLSSKSLTLVAVAVGLSSPVLAQAPHFSAPTAGLIDGAYADGLYQLGRHGGTLLPESSASRCGDGPSQVAPPPRSDGGSMLPNSLLDEEDWNRDGHSTVVMGPTYQFCN